MTSVDFTNTQRRTQKGSSIITTDDNHAFRRENNKYYDSKTNPTRTYQWTCSTPSCPARRRQIFRLGANGEPEDENIFDFIEGSKSSHIVSCVPSTSTTIRQLVVDQAAVGNLNTAGVRTQVGEVVGKLRTEIGDEEAAQFPSALTLKYHS